MHFFVDYQPRLVGPVLTGTADINTAITLHLFSDTSEDISMLLVNKHIPFEIRDKRYRISHDNYAQFPCFEFFADQHKVEAVIFPRNKNAIKPLSPVDGKPLQRADLTEIELLLHAG